MKKTMLFSFFLLLVLLAACSSSGTGATDEDQDSVQPDRDTTAVDENQQDDDCAMTDSDRSVASDSDEKIDNESNDNDTGSVCSPNPCDTEDNRKAHKTRCMPKDDGSSYECLCDVEGHYHDSDGICCPPYSNNKDGVCACVEFYTHPDGDTEQCVPLCTEDTVEGLNGYCPDGQVCQQGTCITDACKDFTCPAHSTCSVKNDAPFCLCDDGWHMSDGICCQENASSVSGSCRCDTGFHDDGSGQCIANADNPCQPNPCANGPLHKDRCVIDSSTAGYHCECNENYQAKDDGCVLLEVEHCPSDLQCLNGYCVPFDLSNEQCIIDDHCHEFPGAKTICSAPNAAGGVCSGCTTSSDCPGETQCMDNGYGTCALMCDDDTDCPYGKCYAGGYCGQARCSSNEDCFGGTMCVDPDGDGSGMCQRIPCKETACSVTNPGGTCPSGEACIEGTCVDHCASDTCTAVNTECKELLGVPSCVCVDGTTLNDDGQCEPTVVTACPSGFTCTEHRCVDKNDIGFVCGENSDCGSSPMECSNALPSGVCHGCFYPADCPGTGDVSPFNCVGADVATNHPGYCMKKCSTHEECGAGMICKSGVTGDYCSKKSCMSPTDCPDHYTCSSSGRCERIPCL